MTTHLAPRTLVGLAAVGLLALTACGTQTATSSSGSGPASSSEGRTIRATQVSHVTDVHEATGMTLLEGPVLAKDDELYLVDVTAPPGDPKLLSVDLKTGKHKGVYTDKTGAYTSAQISPHDGRVYLTEYQSGDIISLAKDGSDPHTFFSGKVDGSTMNPDDIAFDDDGNLYVSDLHGMKTGEAEGRIVRIDRDGKKSTVLADKLAHPNGVMFDPEQKGLWISELAKDTISYLLLDADKTAVTNRHEAIHVDGGLAQTDSIAVDAKGNLYQALHGRPAMAVFSKYGERLGTVEVPAKEAEGLQSATNVAITRGGTDAYMTVSGPKGGYVYKFSALAKGIRLSNGG
ncbi:MULTISPECIES: SMP-30/gluconolactonase/LRE family protein [unclassified Streptomyces]|uniref:SMP-30/gluconolactonase/LRE family protein n=1 Tax=unclassified Streptomyces TaxID=2593676 RepID=UPI002E194208|nr:MULTISPECIES: SMP-30/gluconolactonase/LRE family protein [unclassified Streptomyces]